jgi:hypothetical protein
MMLVGVLEVYDLMGCVKLLTNVVPRVLSLAEATICDLQHPVLLRRRNCTTTDKAILTLQLCELTRGGNVALLISSHAETLLKDSHSCVVLQVE